MTKIKKIQPLLSLYGISFVWFYSFNKLFLFKHKLLSNKILRLEPNKFQINRVGSVLEPWPGINKDIIAIKEGKRRILFFNDQQATKDIKYIWERRRKHFLVTLGLSNNLSDKEYAISFLNDYDFSSDFSDTNSMEISISAINTICTIQLLGDENIYKDIKVWEYIQRSLGYITGNLEKGPYYSNNHYFFDLLGILWILYSIKGDEFTRSIIPLYEKELHNLLSVMINDDGSLYESSVFYHRYVVEALFEFVFSLSLEKDSFYLDVLEKMIGFLSFASTKTRICGIGDNDSGRLLPVGGYFVYSSRDWNVLNHMCNVKNIKARSIDSASDFGLYKLVDGELTVFYRCDSVKNKNVNKSIGSHSHNDQLSVCFSFNEEEVFTDAGTYLYIRDNNYRKENMKTKNHNTICVEGIEQNSVTNDWNYIPRTAVGAITYMDTKRIEGCVEYSGIVHYRTIEIKNRCLLISDKVECNSEQITANYLLHPSISILQRTENEVVLYTQKGHQFLVESSSPLVIEDRFYSEEYGERVSCSGMRISLKQKELRIKIYY